RGHGVSSGCNLARGTGPAAMPRHSAGSMPPSGARQALVSQGEWPPAADVWCTSIVQDAPMVHHFGASMSRGLDRPLGRRAAPRIAASPGHAGEGPCPPPTRELYCAVHFAAKPLMSEEIPPVLHFQDLVLCLQRFWAGEGAVVAQPYDMPMGAGTFHP